MSVECVVRGPNHPFVPAACEHITAGRGVWCGRERSVRSPFGGPGPGPAVSSGGGALDLAQTAAWGSSMGCDSPRPFRLSETTYAIEPITMIENTLITRSTMTIVAASVGGRP